MDPVFITGGTGYIGKRLIRLLLDKGYEVHALVRRESEYKLPKGCVPVSADPFHAVTFCEHIPTSAIFIQLLGVAHPGPTKKELFKTIDLRSVSESVKAAKQARVRKFIYVSVAQAPTAVMAEYQHARAEGERLIRASGLNAAFIRPWYVVGPGHYWPLLLLPVYWLLKFIPATSEKAKALRLVYLRQMLAALEYAVQHDQNGINIMEIKDIRKF